MRRRPLVILTVALSVLAVPLAHGARTYEWPQWRGPDRDGLSKERRLLSRWPDGGPKLLWTAKGIGKGSIASADGNFYVFGENGKVALVKAASRSRDIISEFTIPEGGRGPKWAHPVVCNGRLYIRHDDFLYCYGVEGS